MSQWCDTVVHKAGEDEARERECQQQGQGQAQMDSEIHSSELTISAHAKQKNILQKNFK